MSIFIFLVMIIVISLTVLRYYLTKNSEEQRGEEEPSLKELMLMGVSAPSEQKVVATTKNSKKSFWEKVYSGEGPQPKYMRHIAQQERLRCIEAAKLAESKEKKEKNI